MGFQILNKVHDYCLKYILVKARSDELRKTH